MSKQETHGSAGSRVSEQVGVGQQAQSATKDTAGSLKMLQNISDGKVGVLVTEMIREHQKEQREKRNVSTAAVWGWGEDEDDGTSCSRWTSEGCRDGWMEERTCPSLTEASSCLKTDLQANLLTDDIILLVKRFSFIKLNHLNELADSSWAARLFASRISAPASAGIHLLPPWGVFSTE